MNNNQQGKWLTGIIVAVGLVVAMIYLGYIEVSQPIGDPGDLSEGEDPGIQIKFKDANGDVWDAPDWFSVQKGILGTIVKPESGVTKTCSSRTECPGFDVNPNIECWSNECVVSNIVSMQMGISVQNTGDVPYDDVYVSSATPAIWYTAGTTGTGDFSTLKSVASGSGSASWISDFMAIAAFEGSSQTFDVEITGTNRYTSVTSVLGTGQVTLRYEEDPTGSGLSVTIVSGVPTT